MKAEEVFLKIGNEFFNEILTLEDFSKEPDFNIIPKAMREYARIQIEKDRERIIKLSKHGFDKELVKNLIIILD